MDKDGNIVNATHQEEAYSPKSISNTSSTQYNPNLLPCDHYAYLEAHTITILV